jgi:hypothetical protein
MQLNQSYLQNSLNIWTVGTRDKVSTPFWCKVNDSRDVWFHRREHLVPLTSLTLKGELYSFQIEDQSSVTLESNRDKK